MKHLRIWYLLPLLTTISLPAQAVEIEASFSPALWSYRQSMGAVPGTTTTPMNANVSGLAWLLDLQFRKSFPEYRLSVGLTGESLGSVRSRDEIGNQAGAAVQNTFDINHNELRADILWQWTDALAVGGWAAWQDDIHWRSNHTVSGLRTPFPGLAPDPVRETIQGTWLGISGQIDTLQRKLRLRLDVGVPLAVKTVNDIYPGETFTNNQTLRYNLAASYRLYTWSNGMTSHLTAAYRFRELGNEVRPAAYWPRNQWRVLSLGIRQMW